MRIRSIRSKAALFAGVVVLAGLSSSTASAGEAANWECSKGYVCFYSNGNGSSYGEKCSWQGNNSDWQKKPGCGWSSSKKVRSVYNNGTSGMDVLYYDAAGNHGADKVGCVSSGKKKNLDAPTALRSHKWVGENCR
ncbi:peptidase inhibitor family I36 protein [Streptomyces ureilyticus]|jgi:hypothetical protein|uniref:Peptidase inhibitor family I36 protein n=1 Tax=Streptomyces ureilyticus TaxID=1775131 RepID=A0ABX0DZR0_9ACTN|nr:peptidase inhibitor family I36 protein [Streptomyces ureilyticus]NGO47043.1 peptidase inhibitor family I36 protein [Streptomyces ureilyticus]